MTDRSQNNDRLQKAGKVLFHNRQAFLNYNRFKIDQALLRFTPNDRLVFFTIPRLLHGQQTGFPGYVGKDAPCGIFNFKMDYESRMACEKLFPGRYLRQPENFSPVIRGVLLMGSTGSIAQTPKSDLDYTLLVDKRQFSGKSMALLQKKLRLIEEWTWEEHHLETHFFINDYNDVQRNIFGESDSESTGSALGLLLKEEMYRTMIWVCGQIPFWWVTPVDTDDARYNKLFRLVHSRKTALDPEDFIDMGNVADISEGEFFGGSIWALIKSFQSPFKTLLKMGLLEEYMFGTTKSNLLCHEVKKNVFQKRQFLETDPYLLLFQRVQDYFKKTKSESELDDLRFSFYLKLGIQLRAEDIETGSRNPQKALLINMIRDWAWDAAKIKRLNDYANWQMMQKVAMGNRVHNILMKSYANISKKIMTLDSDQSLITENDTHLLGRKIFSYYRKAPNKVENLSALVDEETAEKELTLLLDSRSSKERETWYLIRKKFTGFAEHLDPENIIHKSGTLPFLIALIAFNKFSNQDTKFLLRAEGHSIKEPDLMNLVVQLSSFLAQINIAAISNEDLYSEARLDRIYLIVDFGNPLPRELDIEIQKNYPNIKERQKSLGRVMDKIKTMTSIYQTSWGELYCKTFSGLNALGRCLNQLSPNIVPEHLDHPNFLKVFIPCGRKEGLNTGWLKSYFIRVLKNKTAAFSRKEAS